jgi:uncharacterized membrane protein YdfJ with MMPL/SSD domain
MAGYSGSKVVGDGLQEPVRFGTWRSLVEYIALVWLKEVKLDLETPDLFAELRQERELLTTVSTEDTENTPFTAAGRMGRRDWFNVVVGTLTILGATVLPPEGTRHIFMMLLRSLAQLRGHTFPELPGY